MPDIKFSAVPVTGVVEGDTRIINLRDNNGVLSVVTTTVTDFLASTPVTDRINTLATTIANGLDATDIEYAHTTYTSVGTAIDYLLTTVGSPPPPPEEPDLLLNETFEGGASGETISALTLAKPASNGTPVVTGSGTASHSSTQNIEGGVALRLSGTSLHTATYPHASHAMHKTKIYYFHEQTPSETAWFYQVMAADGTTVAWRMGIQSDGCIITQNGTSGATAVTTTALGLTKWHRFDIVLDGAGDARTVIFPETAINATTEVGALGVLSHALTATAFSNEVIGLLNAITGGGGLVTGNLINEGFNGTNGTSITHNNTSADGSFGSGSVTFSTAITALEGTTTARFNGTTAQQLNFIYGAQTKVLRSFYFYYVSAPVGGTQWFWQGRNAANTANTWMMGITTGGVLRIRNSNNGTAVDATAAFAANTWYRIDTTTDPAAANDVVVRVYTGGTRDSAVTSNAVWTLNIPTLTNTDQAQDQLGTISQTGVTTAAVFHIDRYRVDSTALPTPIGVTGSQALGAYIDRVMTDSVNMPPNYNVQIEGTGTVSSLLVPSNGCWWGATTPLVGTAAVTQAGLDLWMGFARRRPDIIHYYKSGTWNGMPTSAERAMLEPSNAARAIGLYNWKVRNAGTSTVTYEQITQGQRDSALQTFCNGVKGYPYKLFVCLEHEPENNNDLDGTNPGNTYTSYAEFWRYCVQFCRNQNVTNVVWVWCPTGYSQRAGTNGQNYNRMWPGDDIIDWIAWDPYFQTPNRVDFGDAWPGDQSLINENASAVSGWTGMYNWSTTAKTVNGTGTSTGLAYTFGGQKPLMLAEWGTWFWVNPANGDFDDEDGEVESDRLSDAQAASRIRTVGTQIASYPRIKALVHYNHNAAHFNHVDGHPLSEDAFGDVGELPYLNVGTENAT